MFSKKVKDSIAVAKHLKVTQERTLKVDRKRALYILLAQTIFLIMTLVFQSLSIQFYQNIGSSLVILMVVLILISSIFGFNAVFYVDQTRLGLYKTFNITLYLALGISLLLEQLFWKTDQATQTDNKATFQRNKILITAFFALAFLLDILLICLLRNLQRKWQRTSEKNQLKSAVFNQESYENVLNSSLMMADHEK